MILLTTLTTLLATTFLELFKYLACYVPKRAVCQTGYILSEIERSILRAAQGREPVSKWLTNVRHLGDAVYLLKSPNATTMWGFPNLESKNIKAQFWIIELRYYISSSSGQYNHSVNWVGNTP